MDITITLAGVCALAAFVAYRIWVDMNGKDDDLWM